MRLPNSDSAFIPSRKLVAYLLSESHTRGRGKARFFTAQGYSHDDPDMLAEGLLEIARSNDVSRIEESIHGTKYVVTGVIRSPIGQLITLTTIWITETDGASPRFITAYPVKR
ncbi:MAG: DUF6883 domain-containing protein [Rhodothermales bacterium]